MKQQQVETELLVMAAQQGNADAFTLLFHRYQKRLLQYACKFSGNEDIAREAVQDTWLETANNIRKLSDPRAFRSWLYKKVRWRVLDQIRKQCPVENLDTEDLPEQVDDSTAIDTNDLVREGLRRLPDLEKEMLQFFYLEEMSIAEISVVLDIPIGTVKSRLSKARNLLKQKLSGEDMQ